MAQDPTTPISPEAHQRVLSERDTFKERNAELEAMVRDLGIERKAMEHLRTKVDDPMKWANLSLPHLRDVDLDQIPAKLDEFYGSLYKPESGGEQPKEPAAQPPASPFRGPNPAAEGGSPQPEALAPGSNEWKQVLKDKGIEGLRELDRQGRVQWSDENLRAQGLSPRR